MRSAHHTIHTKTMPKFALPTAVPARPAKMATAKPRRARVIKTQFSARCRRTPRTTGQRVSSNRPRALDACCGVTRLMRSPPAVPRYARPSGTSLCPLPSGSSGRLPATMAR